MNVKGISVLAAAMLALSAHAEDSSVLKTPKEMVSYSIGVDIARNFRQQEMEFDPDLLMKGIHDGLSNDGLLLSEKEVRRVLNGLRADLRRRMEGERRLAAVENKRKGAQYAAANKEKPGVVTLPSGVQYRVLKAGSGRKPTDLDKVICNYRGTRLDGAEFDGTDPGKPATLEMTRLIPGWKEALRLMPSGSKWQIVVPPQLAYGERGVGSDIGPNETLLFEVELLAVK